MGTGESQITVEVAYAVPEKQVLKRLSVSLGTTAVWCHRLLVLYLSVPPSCSIGAVKKTQRIILLHRKKVQHMNQICYARRGIQCLHWDSHGH